MKTGIEFFTGLRETIAYETGCTMTGVNVTQVNDGWRVMLKVKDRNGKPMVSFTVAPTIDDCFYLIDQAIHTTSVSLKWKADKYG